MQLGEIIIVMVIFFFILALGIVFFTQFALGEARKEQSTLDDLNLAETAKAIASLPELHCSQGGDEALYCIDYYKAEAFSAAVRDDPLHYANVFAGYKVDVKCIYPSCGEFADTTLFDYAASTENFRPFVLPVIIYHPTDEVYSYGEVIIWQYS
jgi:hypothetical protein